MNLLDRILQLGPDLAEIEVLGKDGEKWDVLGLVPVPGLPPLEKGQDPEEHAQLVSETWAGLAPGLVREAEDIGRAAGVGTLRVRLLNEQRRVLSTIALTVLGVQTPGADTLPKEWPSDPQAQLAYVLTVSVRATNSVMSLTQGIAESLWRRQDALMGRYETLVGTMIPLHEDRAVAEALSEVDEGESSWAGAIEGGIGMFRELRADARARAQKPIRAGDVPGLLSRLVERMPPEERSQLAKTLPEHFPKLLEELNKKAGN